MRSGFLLLAAVSASSGVQAAHPSRAELNTDIVMQQTPSWCWAATASMALKIIGFADINPASNYQCGVVAAAFPKCEDDCSKCDGTLDSMTSFVRVLNRYSALAKQRKPTQVRASFNPNYVAYPGFGSIKQSLDRSYPVIAGISNAKPVNPAQSDHAVLITGYDEDYLGTGQLWIILRDPYPYGAGDNPWTNAGFPYSTATGRVAVSWSALRDRMNLTSAVFLEKRTARG